MICHRWRRIRRSPVAQQGFTLIEVMISITLFIVALGLLLGSFRFTSKAWDAGERVSARSADMITLHRVIHQMLGRMAPISLETEGGYEYAFLGDGKRLRFPAYLPPYPASGGLHSVEFSISRDQKTERLYLNLAPFDPRRTAGDELPEEQRTLLVETSHQFAFSYRGDGETSLWQEQWNDTSGMPRFIRLQIAGDDTLWPELVHRIQIDADPACVLRELGSHCRLDD